jgi:hypothetical protein
MPYRNLDWIRGLSSPNDFKERFLTALSRPISSALAVCSLVSCSLNAIAQSAPPASSTVLDVDLELHKRFGFADGPVSARHTGRDKESGGGFHAIAPDVRDYYKFLNVHVEKLIEIKMSPPDPKTIPFVVDEIRKSTANCLATAYPFDETLEYSTTEIIRTTLDQKLTHVSDFKATITLSASYLNYIGIKSEASQSESITFQLTQTDSTERSNIQKLTKKEKFDVPPMTENIIFYSDQKKRVEIPITITAILDAQLVKQQIIETNGSVWDSQAIGTLATLAATDPAKRTFTTTGKIYLQGTNGAISSRYLSRPLTLNDAQCKDGT